MDTAITMALSAVAGSVGTKLVDALLAFRKGSIDQEAATRAWYTTEFNTLRNTVKEQGEQIVHLNDRIDRQLATIRQHEETIASQDHTIASQGRRIQELEGKQKE